MWIIVGNNVWKEPHLFEDIFDGFQLKIEVDY